MFVPRLGARGLWLYSPRLRVCSRLRACLQVRTGPLGGSGFQIRVLVTKALELHEDLVHVECTEHREGMRSTMQALSLAGVTEVTLQNTVKPLFALFMALAQDS